MTLGLVLSYNLLSRTSVLGMYMAGEASPPNHPLVLILALPMRNGGAINANVTTSIYRLHSSAFLVCVACVTCPGSGYTNAECIVRLPRLLCFIYGYVRAFLTKAYLSRVLAAHDVQLREIVSLRLL